MKNKILGIGLMVLLIALGTWLVLSSWEKNETGNGKENILQENSEVNENENNQVVDEGGVWFDSETGLEISYSEEWSEYLKIEKKQVSEKDIVKLSFVASDETEQLFFMINVYPSSHSIWQIGSEPNNKIMMTSQDNIFSLTQALDMPYMEGTVDFDRYLEMIEKMDEIVSEIKIKDKSFARIKNIFENNKEGKYNLNISYPEFFGDLIMDKINEDVLSVVGDLKESFLGQVDDWEDMKTGESEDSESMSGLGVNFQLVNLKDNILSFRILVLDYFSSAVHPNNRSLSFNYDLETGEMINLEDIFVGKENYLETLQEKVEAEISKQFEEKDLGNWEEVWPEGIKVLPESFDNFTLTKNMVTFYFDPYEVGPYATGSFEVSFDRDEFDK